MEQDARRTAAAMLRHILASDKGSARLLLRDNLTADGGVSPDLFMAMGALAQNAVVALCQESGQDPLRFLDEILRDEATGG